MTTNYYQRIHEQLLQSLGQELINWPDYPAGQGYTGCAILERVSSIQRALTAMPVRPGQPVMLAMPVTFDLICTLLAVMAAGAIPVLPPAGASLQTLIKLLSKSRIRTVIVGQPLNVLAVWLAKRAGITLMVTDAIPTTPVSNWCSPQSVDADQPALISYSSGPCLPPGIAR